MNSITLNRTVLVYPDNRELEVGVDIEVSLVDNGIGAYECHGRKGYDRREEWEVQDWKLTAVFENGEKTEIDPDEFESEVETWIKNNTDSITEDAWKSAE